MRHKFKTTKFCINCRYLYVKKGHPGSPDIPYKEDEHFCKRKDKYTEYTNPVTGNAEVYQSNPRLSCYSARARTDFFKSFATCGPKGRFYKEVK